MSMSLLTTPAWLPEAVGAPDRPPWAPAGASEVAWLRLGRQGGAVRGVAFEGWGHGTYVDRCHALLGADVSGLDWGPGSPSGAGKPRLAAVCGVAPEHRTAEGMVVAGTQLLGWLALTVADRCPRAAWTAAARLLARTPIDPQQAPAHLLLSRDGTVVWADAPGRRWMGVAERRARVLALLQPGGSRLHWIDAAAVQVDWGAAGSQALALVRITPSGPVAVPQIAGLTRSQYEVAAFAAHGATVAEIADAVNRSVQTVRSHLKAAYQRLGCSNRVELVDCFGAWGGQR